jgi:hypothetical protein
MKQAIKTAPTADDLKRRVLQAKATLGQDFRLRGVYEYFYGKLEEKEYDALRNIWYLKTSDEVITQRIEALADNKNTLPVNL